MTAHDAEKLGVRMFAVVLSVSTVVGVGGEWKKSTEDRARTLDRFLCARWS